MKFYASDFRGLSQTTTTFSCKRSVWTTPCIKVHFLIFFFRLKSDGYWADFIDPSAGVPYYGRNSNTTMFETDDKYRLLGFRIEDLGCCKVICHKEFGRKVFVGTIFTSVPSSNGVIQDLFEDLNLNHLNTFQSNNSPAEAKIAEMQSDILRKSEKRLPLESDELWFGE